MPHGPGRPRDTEIDRAVLEAVDSLLRTDGYRRLTMEAVTRAAGTTKATIRRRWPSLPHLVLEALARRVEDIQPPNTSCALCDLGESLGVFVAAFRTIPPDVLGPLWADCSTDDDLHARFMESLFEPPRRAVREALTRARTRGELRADLDLELAVDLVASLVHYRALFGHAPLHDDDLAEAVTTLMRGMATDYDALEAHSLEVGDVNPIAHQH